MACENPAYVPEKNEEDLNSTNIEISEIKLKDEERTDKSSNLLYSVEDVPPWYLAILLGMQQYLTMIGATIVIPFTLIPDLCIQDDDPARGSLVSTIIFVSGIFTLIQTTFGVRLPIVQGGTFALLVPAGVILTTSFPACKDIDLSDKSPDELQELWQERMRAIQGAIIVASLIQIVIAFTGIIGMLLVYITPLAIVPTISLIGLSLFTTAVDIAGGHWGVSSMTIILMIIFSQFLKNVPVPLPYYIKGEGWKIAKVCLFSLFPVLLTIITSWGICAILTATDSLEKDSAALTTKNIEVLYRAPWILFPYPGQWGLPTVSVSAVLGMVAGVISSMIESIGDYYACARISGASPPPSHAINRGLLTEGIGSMLAGLWGSGNGTTSYSENIGAIGLTKVGSRRVVQYAGLIMLIFGLIGKFGALFVTIPSPVVGGLFVVMFSIITAVGLSSLQFVDLNSSRNQFIIGFSLFMGLALPYWVRHPLNKDKINTGSEEFDQIIKVLLQTSMFIGGSIGLILDNTIPGTEKERGVDRWKKIINPNSDDQNDDVFNTYDLPIGMNLIRRLSWMKFLPISPTYTGWNKKICSTSCRKCKKSTN